MYTRVCDLRHGSGPARGSFFIRLVDGVSSIGLDLTGLFKLNMQLTVICWNWRCRGGGGRKGKLY